MMASTTDSHCAAEEEDYDNAVAALLSPLHQSTTPDAIRAAATRRRNTLHDMHVYLKRMGLDLNDDGAEKNENGGGYYLPPLIFHVTGTKGKGSTLSLCESILRNAHGLNTGMFTSPHLVSLRERIRINGVPVSREVFGRVYWTVRRKLEKHQDEGGQMGDGDETSGSSTLSPLPVLPGYFRMLTLMALYTFCHYQHPKIDAILLEVGMGGRYDATNVFEPPSCPSSKRVLVRAVTLIDYDHTRVLGSTLTQIAWEKGGIFVRDKMNNIGITDGGYDTYLAGYADARDQKRRRSEEYGEGQFVFASGSNKPEVLDVLQDISNNNNCTLQIVNNALEEFPHIGLEGDHQRSNAALAFAMCQYAAEKIHKLLSSASKEKIQNALSRTLWPGRCHTVHLSRPLGDSSAEQHGNRISMNLRCDGAHTPISINACIEWFSKVSSSTSSTCDYEKVRKVLIFNCSHERNPLPLLFSIYESNLFDSVYFCRADFERPSAVPKRLEDGWTKEPLVSGHENGGAAVTLESMCAELENLNLSETVELDPLKISASSWQETLSNLWRVYDMHWRHCAGGRSSSQPSPEATAGLRVNEAILEIQNAEDSTATNSVCNTNNVDKKQVLVEVCVTGSLYMVGSALKAAGWEEGEALGTIC